MQTDPVAVSKKWAQNLGAAGPQIQAGVQALQRSPTDSAAANQAGYLAGVQNAVNTGKWARGLARVNLQSWQQSMTTKGIPRIGTGAQAAIPKMQAFMSQWLPYEATGRASLPPRGDINANKLRATAMIDYNHAFRRQ